MTKASESDGAEAFEEADFMPMIVFIQAKGNMRHDEILAAPLLLLNSVHEELIKISANDMAASMGAGLGLLGAPTKPAVDPVMGETPKFITRDEYFSFVNDQGK